MGPIDQDVVNAYNDLSKANAILSKVTKVIQNLTMIMDDKLSAFDANLNQVVTEVKHIRGNVDRITGHYPSRAVYLAFLLILDIVIWILVAYLLYKIIEAYRIKHERSKKFYDKIIGTKTTSLPANPVKEESISLSKNTQNLESMPPPSYKWDERRSLLSLQEENENESIPKRYNYREDFV